MVNSYCPSCGTVAPPATLTRGSGCVELLLWLCFLVPGMIYSAWRSTSRYQVCPSCRLPGVIPADSPKARQALATMGQSVLTVGSTQASQPAPPRAGISVPPPTEPSWNRVLVFTAIVVVLAALMGMCAVSLQTSRPPG